MVVFKGDFGICRVFKIALGVVFLLISGCGGSGECNPSSTGNAIVQMDTANGGIANGSTNVSLTPMIVLEFSLRMNPVTINSDTIILSTEPDINNINQHKTVSSTQILIGSILANNDNTIFSFSPQVTLSPMTKYYVIVTNNVKSIDNVTITGVFSFTTGEFTAPMVSIMNPNNGAINVSLSPSIQLKFSEAVLNVNSSTVSLHEGSAVGNVVGIGNIISGNDNTYTFSPNVTLNESTNYYVVVSNNITDIANNRLVPQTFIFKTGMLPVGNIYFSPVYSGNNPGGTIALTVNTLYIAESITVFLPTAFKTLAGESSFTCYANLSCTENVLISQNTTAGYELVRAVGHLSNSSVLQSIPIAIVKQFAYITKSNRNIELCNLGVSGFTSCQTTDLSAILGNTIKTYGTVISSNGVYMYIMTGNDPTSGNGIYKCNVNQIDKSFGNCIQQPSTLSQNTRLGAISTNGKYFYYNIYVRGVGTSSINRCDIESNGNLTNCVVAKDGLNNSVERLTIDFTNNNIFVNTGDGIMSCYLDSTAGAITICKNAGGSSAIGLAFNLTNTTLYYTRENTVAKCSYDRSQQILSGCSNMSGLGLSNWVTGIGFYSNFAFVTSSSTKVKQCNIDNTGILSNCSDASQTTLNGVEGIAIFN